MKNLFKILILSLLVFSCGKEDIITLTTEKILDIRIQLRLLDKLEHTVSHKSFNHKCTVDLKYIDDKVYYRCEIIINHDEYKYEDVYRHHGDYYIEFKDKDDFILDRLSLKYDSYEGTIDDMSLKIFRLIDSIDLYYRED